MKKLLLVLLAAVLIVSCQKKEVETAPAMQDVSFKAIEITPDVGLKSTDVVIPCKDDIPTHAWVEIDGVDDYYPELFELGGQLYTQAIKLPIGSYNVTNFVLYKEVDGIEGIGATDIIVFATPIEDGDDTQGYDIYVDPALPHPFTVVAFTKDEIPLEVLCFQEADFTEFGFDWFAVTEIVIRQFCFFGDICIDNPTLYANEAPYSTGGVDVDEEAYFRVIVKEGGDAVPYSPFDNLSIYGTGAVLCVDYPDNLNEVEDFTFELQVWVPGSSGFEWQTYATFTSTDDGPLMYGNVEIVGDDGVVDFAIGTCSPDSNPIFDWL